MEERRVSHCVLVRKHEGKNHLANPVADENMILKGILKKCERCMDWVNVAQYRNRWRTLVIAEMNFAVPQNQGKALTS
jgi:hypothetical protein